MKKTKRCHTFPICTISERAVCDFYIWSMHFSQMWLMSCFNVAACRGPKGKICSLDGGGVLKKQTFFFALYRR